ncbi:uncharacterized protein V1510DRAFT_311244 [Dipodascopsis tothii]|uniref:uncharacterized protein n=1 Tax=Dipodascopsis tothii TaxID=44089 RepID=UPI0034CF0E3E
MLSRGRLFCKPTTFRTLSHQALRAATPRPSFTSATYPGSRKMSSNESVLDLLSKSFGASLTLNNPSATSALEAQFATLTAEQEAKQAEVLALSEDVGSNLKSLNDGLSGQTYLLDTATPSVADLVVFARVHAFVKSAATAADAKDYRHLFRWIDQIQNSGSVALAADEKIAVDHGLALPKEVKAKPEKKGKAAEPSKAEKSPAAEKSQAAPAAAAAAAAPAPAPAAPDAPADKKKEKKKKEKKPEPAKKEAAPLTPSLIDLRVGFIQKAVKHPDADSLYVSTIDMGDADGPRTVCSGLVKYIPIEDMQQRLVVVVANLKPVSMRGIKSCAMVLCASNDDVVELTTPPAGSKAGDKLFFEGFDGTPEPVLNPKKKVFETIQPSFTTTAALDVVYKTETGELRRLVNGAGAVVKAPSLAGAQVR